MKIILVNARYFQVPLSSEPLREISEHFFVSNKGNIQMYIHILCCVILFFLNET